MWGVTKGRGYQPSFFYECDWFSKVWQLCFRWLGVSTVLSNGMNRKFLQFYGLAGSGAVDGKGWMVIWFALL